MARLFIPGPTDVNPEVLAAQAQPMIGHRSQALAELFARIQTDLRQANYDTLMVVHNETSTGIENPLQAIAAAARSARPDVVIVVDAVSSVGGVELETTAWGLDVVVTSSQKCLALPPGLAFAAVSDRALERAHLVPQRGLYFDFLQLEEFLLQNTTPATPAVSLLYALDRQLERLLSEGLAARIERHRRLAALAQRWGAERFGLLAAEGYRSQTVTAAVNTRSVDIAALNAYLAREGMSLADGYGRLKGQTFRIGHMGEMQPADLQALLQAIDAFLRAGGRA